MDKKALDKGKLKLEDDDEQRNIIHVHPTTTTAASISSRASSYRLRVARDDLQMANIQRANISTRMLAPAAARQGEPKTELCPWHWPRHDHCHYGNGCRFAHGIHELRYILHEPSYKSKDCATDSAGGVCPFGERCLFRHGYSLFGAKVPLTRALHYATAAALHDALIAARQEEEVAAKSFSFAISKQKDPTPTGHHTATITTTGSDMCPNGSTCPYRSVGCPLRHE